MFFWKYLNGIAGRNLFHDFVKIGISSRNAAVVPKKGPVMEKLQLQSERDPYKLVNYVCGSDISRENPQDIKIRPDSEYPDWLWNVRTGRALPVHKLDPSTKQYWRRMLTKEMGEKAKLKKLRPF